MSQAKRMASDCGNILGQFEDSFSSNSRVNQTPLTKRRIITEEMTRPIRKNPYRMARKEREAIQEQVHKMLEDDIIQSSKSPWASPVVPAALADITTPTDTTAPADTTCAYSL